MFTKFGEINKNMENTLLDVMDSWNPPRVINRRGIFMRKQMNRQIDWKKTLFSSMYIYIILVFLSINALLFTTRSIVKATRIDEICFWAVISIWMIYKFTDWLIDLTFFVYKDEKKKSN